MKLRSSIPDQLRIRRQRGFLMVDLFVGMAILALAILPVAYSYVKETRMLRAEYFHSVAMELVDGEMEILVAGDARDLSDGVQTLSLNSKAAAILPPGRFQLTRHGRHLRLEWSASRPLGIKPVVREAELP